MGACCSGSTPERKSSEASQWASARIRRPIALLPDGIPQSLQQSAAFYRRHSHDWHFIHFGEPDWCAPAGIVAISRNDVPMQVRYDVPKRSKIDVVGVQRAHDGALGCMKVLAELKPFVLRQLIGTRGMSTIENEEAMAAIALVYAEVQARDTQRTDDVPFFAAGSARFIERAPQSIAHGAPLGEFHVTPGPTRRFGR